MEQKFEVGDIVVLLGNAKSEINHLTIHEVQGTTCVCYDAFGGEWRVSGDEIELVRHMNDSALLKGFLRVMGRNPQCCYHLAQLAPLCWRVTETERETGVINRCFDGTNQREATYNMVQTVLGLSA